MKAFISYSHKDDWALERLHTHLAVLRQENKITEWFDRKILAGGDLDQEISEQLESCHLFLPLVSPDFLASDYCYKKEMERALKRHDEDMVHVVPIIIEPCDWKASPLGKLKALPRDGTPVVKWPNQNEAFLDVVTELRRILSEDNVASPIAISAPGDGPVPTPTDEPERASLVKQTFEERQGLFESKLQAWFSECLERWKTLTRDLAPDSVARFPKGYYATAYILADVQQPLEGTKLLEALRCGEVKHTGWPPFLVLTESDLKPYPYGGNVECWIGRTIQDDGPASADFWRVSPDGMFFLIRGYEEDGHEEKQIAPGTIFDLSFPTWRLGEILLHASSMAHQFKSEDTKVLVKVQWTGLTKRRLASIANRNRPVSRTYVSQQADYSATIEAQANQIPETLPELVDSIVRPLYEQFDFQLPAKLVVEELTSMRKNQF